MKILVIDIETKPSLAYVWSLWDENIPLARLIDSGEMICWAAKWLGEKNVEFASVQDGGRKKMIRRVWQLLDEADVVIHYNGRRFDVPHIQRLFVEEGLTPPSPYKQIDLYETVKRQFKFPSNKLDYVAEKLLGESKHAHAGFSLWVRCMENDAAAWSQMRRYNVGDVKLTEKLYNLVRPWIKAHPSIAALTGQDVCTKCGSDKLIGNGFVTLTTGRYRRFRCKGCGANIRSTKRTDTVKVTEAQNS